MLMEGLPEMHSLTKLYCSFHHPEFGFTYSVPAVRDSFMFLAWQEETVQPLAGSAEEVPELPWSPEQHPAESRAGGE